MTERLPTPGGDNNNWGTILNGYLGVAHNSDGSLAATAVMTANAPLVSVKNSAYTASATTSEIILANAIAGGFTITMPTAVGNPFIYHIKKTDVSSNVVTIATTSSQTIDGSLTAPIRVPYVVVTLVSDGTNWNVV